ncbi:putative ribonuclease H-like domain-containing protein [Tanacetum coccineum]
MNKLVKGNLVRGLPSKLFENDQTCVACQKGKQHRASCKSKTENSISLPLHLLHMDLFGPTFIKSLKKKMYCLFVTYDYSRFTWVFFLATKDETSGIHKVKVIRCDNRTEFKNREMNQFCEMKEAVNIACYVQNRVLVVKPHNKTPYELFHGRTPTLSFMRPFGCPVTILNTIDHLGKFDGKADEGFFVGYSLNSKAFRVFNSRTRIVEENLHIRFSESTPNVVGSGPDWLFDIDALTRIMNYEPIVTGALSNGFEGTKACDNAGQARKETKPVKDYILLPLWAADPPYSQDPKSSHDDGFKPSSDDGKKVDEDPRKDSECKDQEKEDNVNNTNNINTVSSTVNAVGTNEVNVVGGKTSIKLPFDPNMAALEDDSIFDLSRDDEDDGAVADMNNLDTTIQVSPNPTTRIHKDHPLDQVIEDLQSATQTRKMSENLEEHGFVSTIKQRTNHKDLQNCLFACFLSQEEPKRVIHALKDPSWIEAIQEELLQFKLQEVWTLVDFPNGKRAISSKWVFTNKKDERGIVIRNKARLVAQGYTQEKGIDYDKVFAPVARIEAVRLFLAYASFKDFMVYQMDVKNAFLYRKIKEEVYVCQPPGFEDPDFPDRVYKVEKALYKLHQALGAWYKGDILLVQVYVDDIIFGSTKMELCIAFEKLMHEKFQMSSIGELTFFLGLQVKLKKDGIFISQDKYVNEILKKFRSMIGSFMYLTFSRPDIMFKVCACARYQVNPKVSHLHAVKRIFRYLKGQPKLGLWYSKDSPFDLVAYTDSNYAGASLDRKSTTGRCQFLRCRLISWQCKKQTVVANFITEVELKNLELHKRDDTQVPQPSGHINIVADEAVHKKMGDRLVRAATTASSLEADQDSGNITKTRSKATPNKAGSQGTTLGGGPRRQETMGIQLLKLVLDLEQTKTTQGNEIASLKRRVKKLEKKRISSTHKLKRLYKVGLTTRVESSRDEENVGKDASKQGRGINAIDVDEDITLVNVQDGAEMFDVNVLNGEEVFAEQEVAAKDVNLTVDEVTLAQALAALKSVSACYNNNRLQIPTPRKGIVITDLGTPTTRISSQIPSEPSQEKGKGIMVEEPVKTRKKKDLIRLDEETAKRLQVEFDEDERLSREKDEANVALTEELDDIKAKIRLIMN